MTRRLVRRPMEPDRFRQFQEALWMTPAERVIAGHWSTKGSAYRWLYLPWHPAARAWDGYVQEHRVIAERKIGRFLRAGEVVHHRNEDVRDNRPENLEVFASCGEHTRHHHELRRAEEQAA